MLSLYTNKIFIKKSQIFIDFDLYLGVTSFNYLSLLSNSKTFYSSMSLNN